MSSTNGHIRNYSKEVKDGYAAETNSPTHKSTGRYQPLVAPRLEREEGDNELVATGRKPSLKEVEDEPGWSDEKRM